jgi:hypothetical protein
MKWMLSWRENGRLEMQILPLKEAQRLEQELRDRDILPSVKGVRPRA